MLLKHLQTITLLQMVGSSGEKISIILTQTQCTWRMLATSVSRDTVTWLLSIVKKKMSSYGSRWVFSHSRSIMADTERHFTKLKKKGLQLKVCISVCVCVCSQISRHYGSYYLGLSVDLDGSFW